MNKRLYRSKTKRTLAGVCGGLEEYFNIDVTIIRLVWVLISLVSGGIFGLVAYVIAAFIVPEEPVEFYDNDINSPYHNNEFEARDEQDKQ